jgi:hypothetical protein
LGETIKLSEAKVLLIGEPNICLLPPSPTLVSEPAVCRMVWESLSAGEKEPVAIAWHTWAELDKSVSKIFAHSCMGVF